MNKLAVSNIAWEKHDDADILQLLRAKQVQGIEIAPTKIWPEWKGATPASAHAYAKKMMGEGFTIPAMQAILFGKPELQLFGDMAAQNALLEHIAHVASLAAAMGAHVLVFGAPRNRDRGMLSAEKAFEQAVNVFKKLGDACAERGVVLCIEPNPPQYGCNFITTVAEAISLVKTVNSAGFGLHMDAAGMHLAGDDSVQAIHDAGKLIQHFHASEPELGNFKHPVVNHADLAKSLQNIHYRNWISIEMRAGENAHDAIATACERIKHFYRIGQ